MSLRAKSAIVSVVCGLVTSPMSHADTETVRLTCELDITTQTPDGKFRQSRETAPV